MCEQTAMAPTDGGGGGRLYKRGRSLGRGQGAAGGGRGRGDQEEAGGGGDKQPQGGGLLPFEDSEDEDMRDRQHYVVRVSPTNAETEKSQLYMTGFKLMVTLQSECVPEILKLCRMNKIFF